MYKYILFDFDGTVFDTVEGITKSAQYALAKRGITAELDSLRCFAGPPLVDIFMEKFGFSQEEAKAATADFGERYQPIGLYECRVFPGIKELLRALIDAGLHIGIATSKPQNLAEKLLEREGMLELFEVISGSGGRNNNDSKAEVLTRAINALGADKKETVLVGDTKYDVAGAKACGVDCIGVRYGYAAEGELASAGADYIVDDLKQLKSLLLDGEEESMFRPMRRKTRAISEEAAKELLLNEKRGVLAVNGDDGYPFALPVNYFYDRENNKIYFHGAKAGHKVDSLKKSDKVCFTVYGNSQYKEGEWAPYTQSTIVFGRCHLVDDAALTEEKVRTLAEKYYPDKSEIDGAMARSIRAVQLYEITIEHLTGKQVQEK